MTRIVFDSLESALFWATDIEVLPGIENGGRPVKMGRLVEAAPGVWVAAHPLTEAQREWVRIYTAEAGVRLEEIGSEG